MTKPCVFKSEGITPQQKGEASKIMGQWLEI